MAPNNLLHRLYCLRMVRANVEDPPPSHLGNHLRPRLGTNGNPSINNPLLLRHDGRPFLPGSL